MVYTSADINGSYYNEFKSKVNQNMVPCGSESEAQSILDGLPSDQKQVSGIYRKEDGSFLAFYAYD